MMDARGHGGPMAPRGDDREAGARPSKPTDFEALAESLDPLGNPTRLELLHYLTEPHYLEEIASFLSMSRQAAEKHVEKLHEIGAVEKQAGERETGPVREYVVDPQRLFDLSQEFSKLGDLERQDDQEALARTLQGREGSGSVPQHPSLVVVHGIEKGSGYPLAPPDESWTIGRDEERDIPLGYDPYVSNQHAEVRRDGDTYRVVDAFSTNGTLVNWEELEPGEERRLEPGDIIGVGKSLLVYQEG